jgi:hypothetical protein
LRRQHGRTERGRVERCVNQLADIDGARKWGTWEIYAFYLSILRIQARLMSAFTATTGKALIHDNIFGWDQILVPGVVYKQSLGYTMQPGIIPPNSALNIKCACIARH